MKMQSPPSQAVTHFMLILILLGTSACVAQEQDVPKYKNIIRYNLSGAILFGADKYVVFGYERVVGPRQSFSVNVGRASFPKLVSVSTDTFELQKDLKNGGMNVSADYRFYLKKENKYTAPHGLYIGPYYSFSHFDRKNQWLYNNSTGSSSIKTQVDLTIHTIGFEVGYQFIFWKRIALDLLMIGPGIGFYNYEASLGGDLSDSHKEELNAALEELVTQKIPGLSYVFTGESLKGSGSVKSTSFGYRYIIHIGFRF
jgi:hypothetical protein